MTDCKCTLAQRMVGDGCSICNPKIAEEIAMDNICYALEILRDHRKHLAAAIRDAGVTCGTCEHWSPTVVHDPKLERFCLYADSTTGKDYFCADHSSLSQPSEEG